VLDHEANAQPGRERALGLLKRHGWNATSFQILEPGLRYWFDAAGAACVAYVDTGRAWVAAGAPIAAEADLAAATDGFLEAARAAGRRACFFATEGRFVAAAERCDLSALRIGEQPVWDPALWDETLRGNATLRAQPRRAAAKGVVVRALAPAELEDPTAPVRRGIDALIARWQAARPLPPMGFLVNVHAFSHLEERRCFVAERDGQVVGFLSAVPVYDRGGWLFEDLLRDPAAPNGTAEALVDAAMKAAGAAGSRYVTLGLAPLAGPVSGWLRLARRFGAGLYDFEQLRAWKAKLRPTSWESIFISHPRRQGATVTVVDTLSAFARGGLLRFGIQTVLRGPAVLVRLLAFLLLPWTAILALADSARWFPSPAVKWAWVLFDLGLAAALVAAGTRLRRGASTLLASVVTADAALTLWQVAAFNLRRRPLGVVDAIGCAVAVAGPTLVAFLLWRGRAHRIAHRRPAVPATR